MVRAAKDFDNVRVVIDAEQDKRRPQRDGCEGIDGESMRLLIECCDNTDTCSELGAGSAKEIEIHEITDGGRNGALTAL